MKTHLQITIVKLDGSNFLPWPRSALLAIQSRLLSNYLTGEAEEAKISDPSHSPWIIEIL